MDTANVKEFYNQAVGSSPTTYEYSRWEKSAQKKASFRNTKWALERYVIPRFVKCKNILEVGPGPGTWTKLLLGVNPQARYNLVDISREMLAQAQHNLTGQSNVRFVESDILDFSSNEQYDGFFSSRIIEYVPDKAKAISIITQHLVPGAVGFISTKTPQTDRPFRRHALTELHKNQIPAQELTALLIANGCTVKSIINVTSVFPLVQSGWLDICLTRVSAWLPFSLTKWWSESYGIIFQKNDH